MAKATVVEAEVKVIKEQHVKIELTMKEAKALKDYLGERQMGHVGVSDTYDIYCALYEALKRGAKVAKSV